jgi:hypothetical protein
MVTATSFEIVAALPIPAQSMAWSQLDLFAASHRSLLSLVI